jgi:hypothetical protein
MSMNAQLLRDTLTTIAIQAVPESTDLWPGISRRLNERGGSSRLPRGLRLPQSRIGRVATVAMVFVGLLLIQSLLPGRLNTAQAADLARHDRQVEAFLGGDIALVTVTSVANDVATVVVQDSRDKEVRVAVDLRSRIATIVYQGPQLSPALTAKALDVVRADPRTSTLLARGATLGRIMPIAVGYEGVDPTTGQPTQGSATWAQVPLELEGQEWVAYVDLPSSRIDQLIDPGGNQVPVP